MVFVKRPENKDPSVVVLRNPTFVCLRERGRKKGAKEGGIKNKVAHFIDN